MGADIVSSYFVPSLLKTNVGLNANLSQLIGGAVQCMFIGKLIAHMKVGSM